MLALERAAAAGAALRLHPQPLLVCASVFMAASAYGLASAVSGPPTMPVAKAQSSKLPRDTPQTETPAAGASPPTLSRLLFRRTLLATLAGLAMAILLGLPAARHEASDGIDNALDAARLSRYLGNLPQLSDAQAMSVLRQNAQLRDLRLRVTDGEGQVRIGAELPVSATERSVAWTVARPAGPPWTVALVAAPGGGWGAALIGSLRGLVWFSLGAAVVLGVLFWSLVRQPAAARSLADTLPDPLADSPAGSLANLLPNLLSHSSPHTFQHSDEAQRTATRRLLEAQATEHAWLARQLLERLGQHVSTLRLDTIWLRRHLQGDAHTAPVIANLLGQLAAVSQAFGRLLQPLTAPEALHPPTRAAVPPAAYESPQRLAEALQGLADEMTAPDGSATRCTLQFDADSRPLPYALLMAVYRMSQHGLQHLARQAPGADLHLDVQVDSARGRLTWAAQARMATPPPHSNGECLAIAQAHARAFGGLLHADPAAPGGPRLSVELHLED